MAYVTHVQIVPTKRPLQLFSSFIETFNYFDSCKCSE